MRIILTLLMIYPVLVWGQTITGTLTDSTTGKGIDFAGDWMKQGQKGRSDAPRKLPTCYQIVLVFITS